MYRWDHQSQRQTGSPGKNEQNRKRVGARCPNLAPRLKEPSVASLRKRGFLGRGREEFHSTDWKFLGRDDADNIRDADNWNREKERPLGSASAS